MLKNINHITLSTENINESIEFYCKLGFIAHIRWNNGAYLSLSDLWLCLSKGEANLKNDYCHIAFSIDGSDFLKVQNLLKKTGVKEWKSNSSEGKSIYFLDPSGHKLEVHVGDLKSRLSALKKHPYDGVEWFNERL